MSKAIAVNLIKFTIINNGNDVAQVIIVFIGLDMYLNICDPAEAF